MRIYDISSLLSSDLSLCANFDIANYSVWMFFEHEHLDTSSIFNFREIVFLYTAF